MVIQIILKSSMIDSCGQDDPQCVKDVEEQFGPCHEKYRSHWDNYMAAPPETEDKYLKLYSESLYACVVDPQGIPYFVYNPEG